jgi:hypothetical protein
MFHLFFPFWEYLAVFPMFFVHATIFSSFFQLPDSLQRIHYSNVLCGVIQGALEMVHITSACAFVKDQLKGDDVNEILVEVKGPARDSASE